MTRVTIGESHDILTKMKTHRKLENLGILTKRTTGTIVVTLVLTLKGEVNGCKANRPYSESALLFSLRLWIARFDTLVFASK